MQTMASSADDPQLDLTSVGQDSLGPTRRMRSWCCSAKC